MEMDRLVEFPVKLLLWILMWIISGAIIDATLSLVSIPGGLLMILLVSLGVADILDLMELLDLRA